MTDDINIKAKLFDAIVNEIAGDVDFSNAMDLAMHIQDSLQDLDLAKRDRESQKELIKTLNDRAKELDDRCRVAQKTLTLLAYGEIAPRITDANRSMMRLCGLGLNDRLRVVSLS
jgi:hypothetical protein